jgi:hypothetical protein
VFSKGEATLITDQPVLLVPGPWRRLVGGGLSGRRAAVSLERRGSFSVGGTGTHVLGGEGAYPEAVDALGVVNTQGNAVATRDDG